MSNGRAESSRPTLGKQKLWGMDSTLWGSVRATTSWGLVLLLPFVCLNPESRTQSCCGFDPRSVGPPLVLLEDSVIRTPFDLF